MNNKTFCNIYKKNHVWRRCRKSITKNIQKKITCEGDNTCRAKTLLTLFGYRNLFDPPRADHQKSPLHIRQSKDTDPDLAFPKQPEIDAINTNCIHMLVTDNGDVRHNRCQILLKITHYFIIPKLISLKINQVQS